MKVGLVINLYTVDNMNNGLIDLQEIAFLLPLWKKLLQIVKIKLAFL